MRLSKKVTALLMGATLLAASLAGCAKDSRSEMPTTETTCPTETAAILPARAERDGIQTVLAVSLNAFVLETGGYRNGNQADMLMLMVIDESLGRVTALQVNPDTIVSFAPSGAQAAAEMPLGEVVSYGSGGSDSCLNLLKAVSNLLGGIKIDHYMIFSQGAIEIVSDAMGGLTVTVPEDFAEEHPEFTSGEQALLTGKQAEDFFGFRDPADTSNQLHMARQQQFVTALYMPFVAKMQEDDFLTKLTMKLGDRLSTDLALSQMVQLMEVMDASELVETIEVLPSSSEGINRIIEKLFY